MVQLKLWCLDVWHAEKIHSEENGHLNQAESMCVSFSRRFHMVMITSFSTLTLLVGHGC